MFEQSSNWWLYAILTLTIVVSWAIPTVVHNIYFHPLRGFPGPFLQRASKLPWAFQLSTGILPFQTEKIHHKYGPVVRIAPNQLSFTDPKAWKDIYGHRENGVEELNKYGVQTIRALPTSIATSGREEHTLMRRALSHGFSDSSLRGYEGLINGYVDLLIQRLHENCETGKKAMNIEAWYNWTTFDVVGDLVFGHSFGCLENARYHPWVKLIMQMLRTAAQVRALAEIGFEEPIQLLHTFGVTRALSKVLGYTDELLRLRLKATEPRADLFEGLIKKQKEWVCQFIRCCPDNGSRAYTEKLRNFQGLSFQKLAANANVLVIAGSETTATSLSGTTYLLLTHPKVLEKLTHEIRSSFQSASEINIKSVNSLSYMLAVLNESLRMYSPATSGLQRQVPSAGTRIAGHYIPANALVEVQPWSMNYSSDNWVDPWSFRPERFLDQEPGNKLEALQPFSTGPRNCIGRNLAYIEMRVILAGLLYDFDLRLDPSSERWIQRQKAYIIWDRIPLKVYLSPATC